MHVKDLEAPTPAKRRASMSCAKGTQRVFGIDIETCLACAGTVWLTYKALAAQNDGRPQPLANPVRGTFGRKGCVS